MRDVVGAVLVAGLVVFTVGASAWRLEWERPLPESLPLIHAARRRRMWIHLWMLPAMFATAAGVAGFALVVDRPVATVLATMAAVTYGIGAALLVVFLAFRLTVVPWAAAEAVDHGVPPPGFEALNSWAGTLYVVHMVASYAAFALLGGAVLASDGLPAWLGWVGVVVGVGSLAGFVGTRFAGPFNPPILAHVYTGLLGVTLLVL